MALQPGGRPRTLYWAAVVVVVAFESRDFAANLRDNCFKTFGGTIYPKWTKIALNVNLTHQKYLAKLFMFSRFMWSH